MITKLFELEFIDGTKLWCDEQNNKPVYGYMGNGINLIYKQFFDKLPYTHICAYAYNISINNKEYVNTYIDYVEINSNIIAESLLNQI